MKEDIKISIVLPCYNVGKYLDSCLSSISSQTYKNWECIIINDGSPDNVSEIAHRWVSQDSRYVLYEKENGGVSQTRNYGIDKATGSYLYFLDPDDTLYDDKSLEHFYNAIKEYPYDIVFGQMQIVFEESGNVSKPRRLLKTIIKNQGQIISYLFSTGNWSAGNKMYRLDFLREHPQIRYNGESVAEDMEFNFKAYYFAHSMCDLGEITYQYLIRKTSRSYLDRTDEASGMLSRLEELVRFCNVYPSKHIDAKKFRKFICTRIFTLLVVGYEFSRDTFWNIYKSSKQLYFSLLSEKGQKQICFKNIRFELMLLWEAFKMVQKKIRKLILKVIELILPRKVNDELLQLLRRK